MPRHARVSVVVVVLAFHGAVAQAAAPPSGVQPLPASRNGSQPLISFDARGGLLATWASGRFGRGAPFAYASPDGRPFVKTQSGPVIRGEALHPAALAAHGDGEADTLATRRTRVGKRRAVSSIVTVRRGSDGTLSRARRLSSVRVSADEPVLAATSRGDAIAAWVARRGRRRWVQYVTRAAGRDWGRARTVSAGGRGVGDLAVDLSRAGAVLGWRRDGRVEVATGTGRRLGSPASVGPGVAGYGGNLDVAVADTGHALMAWSRVPLTSVGDKNSIRAVRGTVGGGLAQMAVLDRRVDGSVGVGPQVAVGEDGRALVAWRGEGSSGAVFRAATAGPQGPFGPARDLSTHDRGRPPFPPTPEPVLEPQVGVTAAGRAVVAWMEASVDRESTLPGSVLLTELTADGEWTAPRTLWSTKGGQPGNLQLATGPMEQVALAWDQSWRGDSILVAAG